MTFEQCDTFLINSGINKYCHLWIVVIDSVYNDKNKMLCVNITSYRDDRKRDNDPACILNPGDHPFIKHKSFINYGGAYIFEKDKLQSIIDYNMIEKKQRIRNKIFKNIIDNFKNSEFTPQNIIELIEEHFDK